MRQDLTYELALLYIYVMWESKGLNVRRCPISVEGFNLVGYSLQNVRDCGKQTLKQILLLNKKSSNIKWKLHNFYLTI